MATSFITVLNGVITGIHHGDINAKLYGTPFFGHERIEVPFGIQAAILEPVDFYRSDWTRKSDCCLIKEGLLPMPEGYVMEGDDIRALTKEERVVSGLDAPQPGFKVEDGAIVPMTMPEQVAAGQITQEEYKQQLAEDNEREFQRRLAELQTPKALAQAEVNDQYAAERRVKIAALLAVEKQEGWPLEANWPE